MPNIITYEYFNKANDLNLPLAANQPTSVSSVASPNNQAALTNMISEVEKDILVNALGLDNYNALQIALSDLDNADQKWKDLVNGVEYDSKIWEGLNNDLSLIAYAVKFLFLNGNIQQNTAVGVTNVNSENASIVSPNYVLVNCWNKFISKYQGGENRPNIYSHNGVNVIDWYGGSSDVFVSLYKFLEDNKEDYNFDGSNFMQYESKNTFDI